MRRALTALPALFVAMPAMAQTDHDSQLWIAASASVPVADHLEAGLEGIMRFGDDADGLYEAEFGGSISYEIAKGIKLQAGFLRVPRYTRAGVRDIEDRPRQQISATTGFLGGKLTGRLRLEERWRNTGDDMGLRLRPHIKYARPLRAGGKTQLVLSHESFFPLNTTDWGQHSGYERMRNFVGLTTPLVKHVAIEAGYLNQYSFGRRTAHDKMDHVASLSLSLAF